MSCSRADSSLVRVNIRDIILDSSARLVGLIYYERTADKHAIERKTHREREREREREKQWYSWDRAGPRLILHWIIASRYSPRTSCSKLDRFFLRWTDPAPLFFAFANMGSMLRKIMSSFLRSLRDVSFHAFCINLLYHVIKRMLSIR